MRFLFRCLVVLAVAVVAGVVLYYSVQALPGNTPAPNPPSLQRPPSDGNPQSNLPRPERPENNRGEGIRLRSVAGVFGHIGLFAVIVFIAVIAKNLIFGRKAGGKKPD